ncbi:MAG: TIGR04283 family arsenosugar biosynthesis glycosyltransferase [Pirellulaceae bacterium]
MRVSFVIPTLNEAEQLQRAVSRAWEAGAWEVIVADGGSKDDTAEIARQLPCRLVRCPRPGRGIQQNAGAAAASGDVLLFLHADNWLAPQASQQIATALRRGVRAGAFRQVIEAPGPLYRWLERGNAERARRLGMAYGDQGIFLTRRLFEQLGGFAPLRLMEDVDLMHRLRRRRVRLALLPGPIHVSARRWREHGVVRQTARNWLLLTAYHLGVSPDRLAEFYRRRQA